MQKPFGKIKALQTKMLLSLIAAVCVFAAPFSDALAVSTTPGTINYQGRLLSAGNVPLTGNYTFRFSIWSDADWDAGDVLGGGAINVASAGYGGWQEAQPATVGAFGLFNLSLGSVTPIPAFNFSTHKFLQVEVKLSTDPDTSYEVLDPAGTLADANDRKPLENQAYAINADTVDNADVGTSSGNLALLGPGGVWSVNFIPGGTNADGFVIDSNSDAPGAVTLQFGATLAKTLSYVPTSSWFEFNDNVNIVGNLTTTGTVNGVNLSSIPFGNLATRVKELVFTPEFQGGTVEPDGSTNHGTLSTDFIDLGGTSKINYYQWNTENVAIQDMDVVVSVQLPLDFVSFTATPVTLNYNTNDGTPANNAVDIQLFDTTGTAVTLSGGSSLASAVWASTPITFTGAPTFTAGDTITIHLKLSSINTGFSRISDLVLNYNGR